MIDQYWLVTTHLAEDHCVVHPRQEGVHIGGGMMEVGLETRPFSTSYVVDIESTVSAFT